MNHIGTWVWGTKYPSFYIDRLRDAIKRNTKTDYRFHVWNPLEIDKQLTKIPGCFARLRTFDPEWQKQQGIKPHEDRITVVDLDLVVTGNIDHLLSGDEPFKILQNVNTANPCPYNGSLWSLEAGCHSEVIEDFSFEKAKAIPFYAFPDDQAWFYHKIKNAAAYGVDSGVYGFKKNGWPRGTSILPKNACMVAFFGSRDPSQFTYLDWVRSHWK